MTSNNGAIIQRSVASLERLFSVVVGLAVTVAIQRFLFDPNGNLHVWHDSSSNTYPFLSNLLNRLPVMCAFIVSIVPFYHGMNRHLDRTYVDSQIEATKERFLLLDIFVFFVESCFLLALASLVGTANTLFLGLAALLVFDAIWGIVNHGIHYSKAKPSTLIWALINLTTTALLLGIYFSNAFPAGTPRTWALAVTAVARTVFDYWLCWEFYFPAKKN